MISYYSFINDFEQLLLRDLSCVPLLTHSPTSHALFSIHVVFYPGIWMCES